MNNSLFIKEAEARDVLYQNIRDSEHHRAEEDRKFVDCLWGIYQSYADSNFIDEIRNDLNARFWEMYLTCTLLEHGFKIKKRRERPKAGPDILIDSGKKNIWIEAITPSEGASDNSDRVPEMKFKECQNVPDEEIILRYTGAIRDKYLKYKTYREREIIQDHDFFIIAVNNSKMSHGRGDLRIPRIVRSVYPFGNEYLTIDVENGEIVGGGYDYRPEIQRNKGGKVSTDIFMNTEYENISSILFSNIDVCNPTLNMGADFIFVHNMKAVNPIQRGIFKIGREYFPELDDAGNLTLNHNDWNENTQSRRD